MSRQERPMSRVRSSREEAKATCTRLSRWYDLLEGPFERRSRERGQALLHAMPGEDVLEIGFGTGQSLVSFAHAVGSTGTVCGIDLSEGMCRVAQARLQKAHLAARVALTCGDAARLPYATRSFDAVYMSFTLELFDTPDIPIVLRASGRPGVAREGHNDEPAVRQGAPVLPSPGGLSAHPGLAGRSRGGLSERYHLRSVDVGGPGEAVVAHKGT